MTTPDVASLPWLARALTYKEEASAMSIVDHFGRRKDNLVPVPTPRNAPPPPPVRDTQRDAQALAHLTELYDQNNNLYQDNGRLRAELNLALMRCRDLEQAVREMSGNLEKYRRYSVAVRTHLEHVVDAATRANDAAIEAGEEPAVDDKQAEQMINEVERELREGEPPKPAA